MNQQPPCGPENPDFKSLNAKADELHRLTLAILEQSSNPDLPELTQLILKRGNLLGELATLSLTHLTPEEQAELEGKLNASKALDVDIERNLRQIHAGLESHIKGLKENKSLVTKYKLAGEDTEGNHSRNA